VEVNPNIDLGAHFFVNNTLFLIFREEPFLEKKFGEAYIIYKKKGTQVDT
jgi:protein-S-isoprenylcysteine O-methyltransferase Ste14